jgi:hypothetical protein
LSHKAITGLTCGRFTKTEKTGKKQKKVKKVQAWQERVSFHPGLGGYFHSATFVGQV